MAGWLLMALSGCSGQHDELRQMQQAAESQQREVEALQAEKARLEAEVQRLKAQQDRKQARKGPDETEARISPADARKALDDPDTLARMGRVLLNRGPHGEFDGFRLSGVPSDGLLARVGFQNGDILHSVNGLPLTSVEEAMQAYTAVQGDAEFEKVSAVVTRRGQQTTVTVVLDPTVE